MRIECNTQITTTMTTTTKPVFKKKGGVARQVQGVREQADNLDNLSSIPRTHVMEEEHHLPQL